MTPTDGAGGPPTHGGGTSTVLAPGTGVAFEIAAGQRLVLAQTEGGQVADLISCHAVRRDERLSMFMSRCVNRTWKLTAPHVLVSNEGNDLWRIEEDTLGDNYSGGGQCNPALNARWHGDAASPSCERNFVEALARYDLDRRSFDGDTCFNVFMRVLYQPDGEWRIEETAARANDHIRLLSLVPQIVAVSNCPAVRSATNGHRLKALALAVT